jgi:hypothetical protein
VRVFVEMARGWRFVINEDSAKRSENPEVLSGKEKVDVAG